MSDDWNRFQNNFSAIIGGCVIYTLITGLVVWIAQSCSH